MAKWLISQLNCFTEKPSLAPPPPPTELGAALLEEGDDRTSNAVISELAALPAFTALATAEGDAIAKRDAEDGQKLAVGIDAAIEKGVLSKGLKPAPYKKARRAPRPKGFRPLQRARRSRPPLPRAQIDVLGKTADAVAVEILTSIGSAARSGCVVILVGLSGTGKGTTVSKLKGRLPNAMTWSNGNVFRALTLLAVRYCEICGLDGFDPMVLSPKNLASWMAMLEFGRHAPANGAADGNGAAKKDAPFDIRIKGLGIDELVSKIANTKLKERKVGVNIPTVAAVTQGEVVKFAADAVTQLGKAGITVLLEGREQTVDYIPSPHRFCLTMSDPMLIGQRRAAQLIAADAFDGMCKTAAAAGKETPYGLDEAATRKALRGALAEISGEPVDEQ